MAAASPRNNTPLLLLLDGILSQDEQSTGAALAQIEKLDPTIQYLHHMQPPQGSSGSDSPDSPELYESPLRSASTLECIVGRLLAIKPHLARVASESDGSLPLHFAASIGNLRVVALLLNHHRDAALTHNTKGKIPLHYAAREGRIEMVRFLLRLVPACAAVLTKKGKLALHFAAGEGHTEVVRDLLRVYPNGAVLPSKKGKVALHFAARWGHIDIARDLYRIFPGCIHTLDYDGSNPLHDATREGQLEMSKFLVERYPPVMYKSNIRGEIPLLAAIRSGNVPLCAFLIRSWPESGKQVLQTIRDPDDVSSWEPAILDLCLRGAVSNFTDLSPEERGYIDDHTANIIDSINGINYINVAATNITTNSNGVPTVIHDNYNCGHIHPQQQFIDMNSDSRSMNHSCSEASLEVASISVAAAAGDGRSGQNNNNYDYATAQRLPPVLNISLPRSKSPILETDDCGKKRSASDGTNGNKRQRRGSIDEDDDVEEGGEGSQQCSYCSTLEKHTFYQVHAALECSATTDVLRCVLERYPEQHTVADDYGRLPLHIASSHCRSEGSVDLILKQIWEPNQDACFDRDYFGRLPLHLALMTRADFRFVRELLDANPSSGVEQCQVVDERFAHKLPIHMAISHGCDLSTLFMLVRGDPQMVHAWKS